MKSEELVGLLSQEYCQRVYPVVEVGDGFVAGSGLIAELEGDFGCESEAKRGRPPPVRRTGPWSCRGR